MVEFDIHRGKIVDLQGIAELENNCFEDPYSENQISEDLASDNNLVLVAYDGELLIGYIDYKIVLDEAELLRIAVLKQYRGLGLGSKMIAESYNYLEGVKEIFLEVASNNKSAIQLYKKNSFDFVSVRTHYYKNGADAIVMKKEGIS